MHELTHTILLLQIVGQIHDVSILAGDWDVIAMEKPALYYPRTMAVPGLALIPD